MVRILPILLLTGCATGGSLGLTDQSSAMIRDGAATALRSVAMVSCEVAAERCGETLPPEACVPLSAVCQLGAAFIYRVVVPQDAAPDAVLYCAAVTGPDGELVRECADDAVTLLERAKAGRVAATPEGG